MGNTLEKVKGLGRRELAYVAELLGHEELEATYIEHLLFMD